MRFLGSSKAAATPTPLWRTALDLVTTVIMLAAALAVLYRNFYSTGGATPNTKVDVPSAPQALQHTHLRGSDKAPAVLIIYSDFECPYCRQFTKEVLPKLEERYVAKGQVQLSFRYLPLPSHPHAVLAATAAECAGEQQHFWEMHDKLFAANNLDGNAVQEMAASLRLDPARFSTCLQDSQVLDRVIASQKAANDLGVRATPTFFVGSKIDATTAHVVSAIAGARPFRDFSKEIDSVLARRQAAL